MRKIAVVLLLFAGLVWAADISGNWVFNVETDAGSGSPTFVFKQDGEKLTGTYHGAFGDANIAGTVQGDKVEFSFDASPTGEKMTIKYVGTLDGPNKIKGTVDLGGLGKGTFTGEKK